MNERFKFRFWNEEKKKYEELGNFPNSVNEFFVFIDNYVIEQSIGLKDKNDKLIYEGDIVSLPWQAGWKPLRGVVKFDEKTACFLLSKNKAAKAYHSFWWNESKEVIGNIHENPELLENQ